VLAKKPCRLIKELWGLIKRLWRLIKEPWRLTIYKAVCCQAS
jgi:hypothetical protein